MKYLLMIFILISVYAKADKTAVAVKDAKQIAVEKAKIRRQQLIEIIDREFKVLSEINQSKRGRDPRPQYRLLELYAEKIKLIREDENKAFLEADFKVSQKLGRKYYFKKSKKLYLEALSLGRKMLKMFPAYKNRAEIYYTLALNSRDYEKGNITERYLLNSISIAKQYGKQKLGLIHNARASLADYYYNEKKFKKAIPYYKLVIRNLDDDWNTKYTYNLSWCYIKSKKYNTAIDVIKTAFFNSKKEEFIDVSDQVLDHIGLFYALADRVPEGIKFYTDNTDKPVKYLIKMSSLLIQRGLFNLAEMTLEKSIPHADGDSELADIYVAMMDLHQEHQSIEKHFAAAKKLYEVHQRTPLTKAVVEDVTLKLTNFVNHIQKGFQNKTLRLSVNMEKKFARIVINYFEMLSVYDAKDASKYFYFIGETHYSTGEFGKGLAIYQKAFNSAGAEKKPKKEKIKILTSMLSTLGDNRIAKKTMDEYLVWTYESYLQTEPKSKVSYEIYKKLYSAHFANGNFDAANEVTQTFHKLYPKDKKLQKDMVAQILDHYIEKKDPDRLNGWIQKLEGMSLKFSKDFVNKTELKLGKILFDKYNGLVKQGKPDQAIEGYAELFAKENYPGQIRTKSAFNAAVLELENGNPHEALNWAMKAWDISSKKEKLELVPTYLAISEEFFLRQEFKNASLVANKNYLNLCKKKHKLKDEFFKKSVVYSYANGDEARALRFFETAEKCNVGAKMFSSVGKNLINMSFEKGDSAFFKVYRSLGTRSQFKRRYAELFFNKYKDAYDNNDSIRISTLGNELDKLQPAMTDEFKQVVKAFMKLPQFKNKFNELIEFKYENDEEVFNPEKFNKQLQTYFAQVQGYAATVQPLIDSGYSEVIVRAYAQLITIYERSSDLILNVETPGKEEAFVKSFKGSMIPIANQFRNEAKKFQRLAYNVIQKSPTLVKYGLSIWNNKKGALGTRYEYYREGLLADI